MARPATAPVSNPKNLGFLHLAQSISSQTNAAKEAATSVFKKARAVTESTPNSLPALNPYQPNQSKPVPIATNGKLWGSLITFRFPTNITEANAAIPAEVCHYDTAGEVEDTHFRQIIRRPTPYVREGNKRKAAKLLRKVR